MSTIQITKGGKFPLGEKTVTLIVIFVDGEIFGSGMLHSDGNYSFRNFSGSRARLIKYVSESLATGDWYHAS